MGIIPRAGAGTGPKVPVNHVELLPLLTGLFFLNKFYENKNKNAEQKEWVASHLALV